MLCIHVKPEALREIMAWILMRSESTAFSKKKNNSESLGST